MNYAKLRKEIENNKLGVSGLFEKLNMNRGKFYYAMEKQSIKIETLEKICKVLGVPIGNFFLPAEWGVNIVEEPVAKYEKQDCEEIKAKNSFLEEQNQAHLQSIKALSNAVEALTKQPSKPVKMNK